MSTEDLPYSPLFIKAWTALSILIAFVLLLMFVFNGPIVHAGNVVWNFLRELASPFI